MNSDFKIFNIAYGIMYYNKFPKEQFYGIDYYFLYNNQMSIFQNASYDSMKKSPEEFPLEGLEGLAQPHMMLYHHDRVYYEYIIPQKDE